jgi:hypothetical protein
MQALPKLGYLNKWVRAGVSVAMGGFAIVCFAVAAAAVVSVQRERQIAQQVCAYHVI